VFLDEPFPKQLPVVESCQPCNQRTSTDEEYLASFLEVVLCGSAEPTQIGRAKIRKALEHSIPLKNRIESCRSVDPSGQVTWLPDRRRVASVVEKLARGHVSYEYGFSIDEQPTSLYFFPFVSMNASMRKEFEEGRSPTNQGWPELGSRAFVRAAGVAQNSLPGAQWIEVQQRQYRYSVSEEIGITAKIAISEYLACVVEWEI